LVGQGDELFVPGVHQVLQRVFGEGFLDLGRVVVAVVLAEFDDLFERGGLDVGQVDFLFNPGVLDHVFQEL